MENSEVFDFHRIFFGDYPYNFLLEIIFRTLVMYVYTIFLLRVLGKRSMGQLSTLELAIIICFGSAVGDPMMGAEIPILHGMVVITTVALLQWSTEWLINRNRNLEALMEGRPDCLVSEGLIVVESLERNSLSHEDLFRALRGKDIHYLGQVGKAFFETSGTVSVWCVPEGEQRPGLGVLPEEHIPSACYLRAGQAVAGSNFYSCTHCGHTRYYVAGRKFVHCGRCHRGEWMASVMPG
ncbi:DUF421 domain-containing protein [Pedobacter sp.]